MLKYYINLTLSNFIDARVIEDEDSEGDTERGLFIPLAKNGIMAKKDNQRIKVRLFVSDNLQVPGSYYLKLCIQDKDVRDQIVSNGFRIPVLGYMFMDKSFKNITAANVNFSNPKK